MGVAALVTQDPLLITAVQGTWGWSQQWWQLGSEWWRFMGQHDAQPNTVNGRLFRWSTGLGSSLQFWRRDRHVVEWEAAGDALSYYLDGVPLEERIVVAHSHGGQVAFFAASNLPIHRLITIGTPVREDMRDVVQSALPNLGSWMHVCDIASDYTAWWGAFGDGHVGNAREFTVEHPHFAGNVQIANIGHSGLLNDPSTFTYWTEAGLLQFLRSE